MNEDRAPVADEGEHKRRLSFIASTVGAVLVAALVGGGILIKNQSDAAEDQRIADQAKLLAMQKQQEKLVRQLKEQQDCVPCFGLWLSCDGGCPLYGPGLGDHEPPHLRQLRKGGSETEPVPGLPSPRSLLHVRRD